MPRRSLSGKVISSNNNKTIVVEVTRKFKHPFYEKIINNNFDKPDKLKDYLFKNMLYRSSERNVLLFNHPEFLKA